MIIVEERINDVFSQFPEVCGDKPIYSWGDEQHLNAWLGAMQKASMKTYPLIYQTSKLEKQNISNDTVKVRWEAILATQNTNTSLFNDQRWQLSFKNVLVPLSELIVAGFEQAGFIIENDIVDIEKYGNYGDGNEHWTIDIWDALTFKCDVIIHNNCVKNLDFDV